jgi:hypothetical protein
MFEQHLRKPTPSRAAAAAAADSDGSIPLIARSIDRPHGRQAKPSQAKLAHWSANCCMV